MNYLDLFSGIGGFPIGAYNAGWRFENHYYSEVDEYAIKVYQRRFPDAIPLGDITKIDGKALADSNGPGLAQRESKPGDNGQECQATIRRGGEWLITGGFPCQDISVAGKGAGIGGSRSGLWFEMWRLIRDLRPRYAIIENVGAITTARRIKILLVKMVGFLIGTKWVSEYIAWPRKPDLLAVLEGLAQIGFDAEWQDIRASDMGAPHRRERIWIVAYPSSDLRRTSGNERHVASDGASPDVRHPDRQGQPAMPIDAEEPRVQEYVADTRRSGRIQPKEGEWQEGRRDRNGGQDVAYVEDANGRRADATKYARRGHPEARGCGIAGRGLSDWATEPDVGRVAHGIPSRVDRLKALGNSIVPQIAEMIFRQIGATNGVDKNRGIHREGIRTSRGASNTPEGMAHSERRKAAG